MILTRPTARVAAICASRPAVRPVHRHSSVRSRVMPRRPRCQKPMAAAAGNRSRCSRCPRFVCSASEPCDRLMANRPAPRIVYGCLHQPSTCRSAHGRRSHRVSRAKPTPAAPRPRGVSPLRALPPREDPASQDRVGEPRELARVAESRRAGRAGDTSRTNSAAISSAGSSASHFAQPVCMACRTPFWAQGKRDRHEWHKVKAIKLAPPRVASSRNAVLS